MQIYVLLTYLLAKYYNTAKKLLCRCLRRPILLRLLSMPLLQRQTEVGLGHHVAVADGCHGDDGPPQTDRYGVEVIGRVVLRALGIKDERREDHNPEHEEKHQQTQLVCTRLQTTKNSK